MHDRRGTGRLGLSQGKEPIMAATNGRNLRAVALCVLAWVGMGFVSLLHHAVVVVPADAPSTTMICHVAGACTR